MSSIGSTMYISPNSAVMKAKIAATDEIMAIEGVRGIGITKNPKVKNKQEPAIVILIANKEVEASVPKEISGFLVVTEIVGNIHV